MKVLLVLASLIYLVKGQVVVPGKCPDLADLPTPLDKEKVFICIKLGNKIMSLYLAGFGHLVCIQNIRK